MSISTILKGLLYSAIVLIFVWGVIESIAYLVGG